MSPSPASAPPPRRTPGEAQSRKAPRPGTGWGDLTPEQRRQRRQAQRQRSRIRRQLEARVREAWQAVNDYRRQQSFVVEAAGQRSYAPHGRRLRPLPDPTGDTAAAASDLDAIPRELREPLFEAEQALAHYVAGWH